MSQVRRARSRRRAKWCLKSCDRLFDLACRPCDLKQSQAAREEWKALMSTSHSSDVSRPVEWSRDPIESLKSRVRDLVGDSWAVKREKHKESYVPDQQGCFENERRTGGTLGVLPEEESSVDGDVVIGVAKTKGKFRVVTMQSARVKRVLAPIHNALYDHISSFGWCVRGDVTRSDFAAVANDLLHGERFVSADFTAATNNLDPVAVRAVVDVLCESKHLTDCERSVLRGSFRDLRWFSRSTAARGPILKGSMMGNLVSFPVLCLINKACYDLARDIAPGQAAKGRKRKCRVNGDDLMYCGSDEFFSVWKMVVTHYGLIVNEEKTGRSGRFLELNSRSFDTLSRRILPKATLGFFRRDNTDRDLLGEIFKSCEGFSPRTIHFIVNQLLRYEITLREARLTTIPQRFFNVYRKHKWFRNWLDLPPPVVIEYGLKRTIPMVVSVPPRPPFYAFVTEKAAAIQDEMVSKFRGNKKCCAETVIDRRSARLRFRELSYRPAERFLLELSPTVWSFVWPEELFTFVSDSFPTVLSTDHDVKRKWIEDHPFLTTRKSLVKTCTSFRTSGPDTSLLVRVNVGGFVNYPNGPV